MDDLISRGEAIKTYQRVCVVITCGDCPFRIIDGAFTDCRLERFIKALPAARPERKVGKWINDRGLYKCSSCNGLWTEFWVEAKPIERMRKEMPYCPMCGSYNGEEARE